MSSLVCRGRLDFLSDNQKVELSRYFSEAEKTAMPHQLAILLGLEYHHALAILAVLEADGLSKNLLLIYHNCTEEPVDAIPFGTGFPKLPYVCPNCENVIENEDDMSFDFMAKTDSSIEFI